MPDPTDWFDYRWTIVMSLPPSSLILINIAVRQQYNMEKS
jgi:hypothetical protein